MHVGLRLGLIRVVSAAEKGFINNLQKVSIDFRLEFRNRSLGPHSDCAE
jgi:hypothetical protein